jgi:hypothetical protein
MFRSSLFSLFVLVGSMGAAIAQTDKSPGEEHMAHICGLRIGMTPEEVLNTMKRPPDVGEVRDEDIVSGWQMPGGDFLSVRFYKKRFVSYLTLDYRPTRQRRDLSLPSDYEHNRVNIITERASPVTGSPQRIDIVPEHTYTPGIHLEYEVDETQNGERLVWYRPQKEPKGYEIEIGFQSASRLKVGERNYKNEVTSKYIAVRKSELPKFEKTMMASPNPSGAYLGTKTDSEKKKQE